MMNAAMTPPEIQLVNRIKTGDARAFDELYFEHKEKLKVLATRFLHNAMDAEEVANDTLLRFYRAVMIGQFRGDSSIATFLYRIALNLARNRYWYWKRRKRDVSLSLDATIGDSDEPFHTYIASDAIAPNEEIGATEEHALILECIPFLDERHREILNLWVEKKMRYEEIAQLLNIGDGTVKSRLARARIKLRDLLAARKAGVKLTPLPEYLNGRHHGPPIARQWKKRKPRVAPIGGEKYYSDCLSKTRIIVEVIHVGEKEILMRQAGNGKLRRAAFRTFFNCYKRFVPLAIEVVPAEATGQSEVFTASGS